MTFPRTNCLAVALERAPMLATLLALALSLSACGLMRGAEVVDDGEYKRLIRLMPKEMQAQGLADASLAYRDLGAPAGKFGKALFERISPDFLFRENLPYIYLGETFRRTLTPKSRVTFDADGQGFVILHPTQRLHMRMLAVTDWNRDKTLDWLMLCTVESYRGNRTVRYYVLAPEPRGPEPAHGTIMASVEDMGPAMPIVNVRDLSGYGAGDAIPPTEVEELVPGQKPVTTPPAVGRGAAGAPGPDGGVRERDI